MLQLDLTHIHTCPITTLARSQRRAICAIQVDIRCAHVGVVVSRRILCEEFHTNASERDLSSSGHSIVMDGFDMQVWFWPHTYHCRPNMVHLLGPKSRSWSSKANKQKVNPSSVWEGIVLVCANDDYDLRSTQHLCCTPTSEWSRVQVGSEYAISGAIQHSEMGCTSLDYQPGEISEVAAALSTDHQVPPTPTRVYHSSIFGHVFLLLTKIYNRFCQGIDYGPRVLQAGLYINDIALPQFAL